MTNINCDAVACFFNKDEICQRSEIKLEVRVSVEVQGNDEVVDCISFQWLGRGGELK